METCGHCKNLMNMLINDNIQFKTIDANRYYNLFETLKNSTGFDHVPQMIVNEWDGKEFINTQYISDFDSLEKAIEQVKNLLK
jgi:glutaredoxin